MILRLLDVNVLISLLDSAHVHHAASVKWFGAMVQAGGWATCPVTENGFIRVVSHGAYPNMRLTPALAAQSLARFKAGFPKNYSFWPDEVSLTDATLFKLGVLIGSRQTTDAYLAGLTLKRGGRLATIDGSIPWNAIEGGTPDLIERIVP